MGGCVRPMRGGARPAPQSEACLRRQGSSLDIAGTTPRHNVIVGLDREIFDHEILQMPDQRRARRPTDGRTARTATRELVRWAEA